MTNESLDVLYRTVYHHLSEDQFAYAMEILRARGIEPWSDAYYIVIGLDGEGLPVPLIRMKIAGIRKMAHDTKKYAGCEACQFVYGDDERIPVSAHASVYRRMEDGTTHRFVGVAHWCDYAPADFRGTLWERMPHHCLSIKAEAVALRMAFPENFAGIYEEEFGGESDTVAPTARRMRHTAPPLNPADCPDTPMAFRLRLSDYGIRGEQQDAAIARLRQLLPAADERTFFRNALSLIRGNPTAWGGSHPVDDVG